MLSAAVEEKDIEKMDAEYREILVRVLTIPADRAGVPTELEFGRLSRTQSSQIVVSTAIRRHGHKVPS